MVKFENCAPLIRGVLDASDKRGSLGIEGDEMLNRFQRLHGNIEGAIIGVVVVLAVIAYGVSRFMVGS